MKNVLHYIPNFNIGGIESLFYDTLQYIDKSKISISLLVESESNITAIESLKSMGCNVFVIPKPKLKDINTYYEYMNDLMRKNNFDIVHSHSPHRSFLFFLAAKKNNISKRIIHAHTTKLADTFIKAFIYRSLLTLGNKLATHLVAVSNKSGEYYYGKKIFLVLNNGIDTDKFTFDSSIRTEIRKELNLVDKYVIGHVGRFSEPKNHSFLINIFNELNKEINNSHLLLVGDGPLMSNIKLYVDNNGLASKVTFVGRTNRTAQLYQAMDYFVFPSLYEGFPLTLIEAQSAGLKILSSDRVTDNIKLTDLVTFMSLENNEKEWANYIIDNQHYQRSQHTSSLKNSSYDIHNSIKDFEELYINS